MPVDVPGLKHQAVEVGGWDCGLCHFLFRIAHLLGSELGHVCYIENGIPFVREHPAVLAEMGL